MAINSVNANACEFLEVLLRELNAVQDVSLEVNHLIIKILVKTFKTSISNENTQLQMNLLNIFKAILFKSHFYSAELRHEVETGKEEEEGFGQKLAQLKSGIYLFEDKTFLVCLADGL